VICSQGISDVASLPLMHSIQPVDRDTLGDRAYRRLRELLMSGQLAPGERLSLRSVADALGVSIMPVRGAVSRLVADHALEVTPSRAIRVPLTTVAQFRQITEIRIEIEGFAAARAAHSRSPGELDAIAVSEAGFRKESMAARPDLARAVQLNMNFHFAVYRASGMPMLVEIVEQLWLRVGPIINLETRDDPGRLATGGAYRRHGEALEAIRRGDGEAARAAIAADIEGAAAFIIARGDILAG
jgi:DNA-binding GntR family transcriptional regulator